MAQFHTFKLFFARQSGTFTSTTNSHINWENPQSQEKHHPPIKQILNRWMDVFTKSSPIFSGMSTRAGNQSSHKQSSILGTIPYFFFEFNTLNPSQFETNQIFHSIVICAHYIGFWFIGNRLAYGLLEWLTFYGTYY